MPLPTPNDGESKEAFMSRCMSAVTKSGEFKSPEQCAAVCLNKWADKNDVEDDTDEDDASRKKHNENQEKKKKDKKEKNGK